MKKLRTRNHSVVLNRGAAGDAGITFFLVILGVIMFLPLYYTVMQSFKPLDELFYYPPDSTLLTLHGITSQISLSS